MLATVQTLKRYTHINKYTGSFLIKQFWQMGKAVQQIRRCEEEHLQQRTVDSTLEAVLHKLDRMFSQKEEQTTAH